MSVKNPSSDDIIFALEALGFDVDDEDDNSVTLVDGNFTVNVNHSPSRDEAQRLRTQLNEVFADYEDQVEELIDDYESADYDESVKRIVDWLKKGN
ncbi:hypothetical protein GF359_06550 [candidate division WOR-3 bacterium]|uniref:Uncharacterized protein n=1 Tax=candidate division WOR-3 bacterium TaxID=2052148 RepID=A0A9D5QCN1_UNCW3|nr:hypothetical protein [candidate division WOR-3 bacterium]MBD3364858.1 hypothetical protein [candidate division WOR-3 bacterium]